MNERPVYIYILTDPRTDEVRYVGKANNPEQRLRQHCRDKSMTHRTHWIRHLKAEGLRPLIRVIEEVSDAVWQEREQYWIAHYRAIGVRLVNGTDGGDGTVGYKPTAEQVRLHAAKIRGRKATLEQIAAQSAATKGKPKPANHPCHFGFFRGRTHTAESKAKMSTSATARGTSEAQRRKIGDALRGRKRPPDVVAKIAESNRRNAQNPMVRERISKGAYARYEDEAQREQARQIALVREAAKSPEAKAKDSARMTALWADPVWAAKTRAAMKDAKARKKAEREEATSE